MKKDAFRDFLSRRGLRSTREREAIMESALRMKGHFDPEELLTAIRRKGMRASRASVYRTLPLLLEAGLIEEVGSPGKNARYEISAGRGHHDHMLCTSCGRVIEFYSGAIERLQEELCRRESFKGESHTLEIRGTCGQCRRKGGRRSVGPGRPALHGSGTDGRVSR